MLEINKTQGRPWATLKYLFDLLISVTKAEDLGAPSPRQARRGGSWGAPQ